MGLAGGIVRKVFSKSPCSSAATGASRSHSEKVGSTADHRRRWSSLRLYLCGEEMNNAAAAEDDDDDVDDEEEAVSVKSFETCSVMPPPPPEAAAHVVVVVPVVAHHHRLTSDASHDAVPVDNDDDNPAEHVQDQRSSSRVVPGGDGEQNHYGHVIVVVPARDRDEQEGAATLIQSAFRSFMARRQLQELRTRHEQEQMGDAGVQEDQEPTTASVATSVLVQVSESLSNLRLMSEDSASVQQQQQQQQRSSQQRSSSRPPAPVPVPAFRVKEEWDDSTVSSNVSRMRMQSRIEATTRRERALAYAFSQQLRSCGGGCGGSKKRSARAEQGEFNVGWSWLERWMATRPAEPSAAADDCMSRNAETGSAAGLHRRRVVVVRRRNVNDLAGEEKESCGSNDVVSVVSFDGSSSLGGGGARSGLSSSCHKPPGSSKSRLKAGRNLQRRKQVAASEHRCQARSHKVSKKGHQRVEQEPHRDRLDAGGFDDAYQPPTDY